MDSPRGSTLTLQLYYPDSTAGTVKVTVKLSYESGLTIVTVLVALLVSTTRGGEESRLLPERMTVPETIELVEIAVRVGLELSRR